MRARCRDERWLPSLCYASSELDHYVVGLSGIGDSPRVWLAQAPAAQIIALPLADFDIVDNRVSPEWVLVVDASGARLVEPELAPFTYFIEDMADGIWEAIEAMGRMFDRIGRSALAIPGSAN